MQITTLAIFLPNYGKPLGEGPGYDTFRYDDLHYGEQVDIIAGPERE